MRHDYCPMANEPCQSMCDTPCSAHRLKIAPESDMEVYRAIAKSYRRDTAPQPAKREPLTDEEVLKIWSPEPSRPVMGKNKVLTFARAIERAHGIGEQE